MDVLKRKVRKICIRKKGLLNLFGNGGSCRSSKVLFFSLLLFFSVNVIAAPSLTQEGLDAYNDDIGAVFEAIHGDLTEKLKKSVNDGLDNLVENSVITLQEIDTAINDLDARLRETACGIVDDLLDFKLEQLRNVLLISNPLSALDPLNVNDKVISSLENIYDNIKENPFDPGGILSAVFGNDGWKVKLPPNTRDELIAIWTSHIDGTYVPKNRFDRRRIRRVVAPGVTFEQFVEYLQTLPDGDTIYTFYFSEEKGGRIATNTEGETASCGYAANILDSTRDRLHGRVSELIEKFDTEFGIIDHGDPEFTNFNQGPKLALGMNQELKITFPGGAGWGIMIPITVRDLTGSHQLEISISNLQFSMGIGLEGDASGKINIASVSSPSLGYDLDIDTDGLALEFFVETIERLIDDMLSVQLSGESQGTDLFQFALSPIFSGLVTGNPVPLPEGTPVVLDYIVDSEEVPLLQEAAVKFSTLISYPFEPLGNGRAYPITPPWPELETIVKNIDDKIIAQNMHLGFVSFAKLSQGSYTSWKEAFSPGGEKSPGIIDDSHIPGTGNGPIWTGTYLGALAHRYKILHDNQTKGYIASVLDSVERMFLINGSTGLLSRSVVRYYSSDGTPSVNGRAMLGRCTWVKGSIDSEGNKIGLEAWAESFSLDDYNGIIQSGDHCPQEKITFATIDGELWIGRPGLNGISRDQYSGVLFGLFSVYDLVDEPMLKARSKDLIELALDYIIANDWILVEDRNLFSEETKAAPTFWAGINYQKITFLTIGNKVAPGKYSDELEDSYKLLDSAWLSAATASPFNPFDGPYKYNLFYTNLYSYLKIDKDPERRALMLESARIPDYYIGHHNNAFFDLVRATYTDQEGAKGLRANSKELLKRALLRGHRTVKTSETNIEIAKISDHYQEVFLPMASEARSIQDQPLDPVVRESSHFIWEKGAFFDEAKFQEDIVERPGDALVEEMGVDISLVYWMMRTQEQENISSWLVPVLHLLLH